MATKERKPRRVAGQTIQVTLPPSTESPADETPTPEEEELDEILARLPENTIAKVYRIREDGQREFIVQTTPQAATEERCQKAGPGTYRIVFYGPVGQGGKKGFKGQRTVYVGVDAAAAAAVAPNGSGGSVTEIAMLQLIRGMGDMQSMQAQQSREHSLAMATLMEKIARPPERDPLLGELVKTLVAGGSERKDPIEQATKIAELANNNTKRTATGDILDTLDLVERIRGDGGGNDRGSKRGWLDDIAKAIIPRVMQHIAPTNEVAPVAHHDATNMSVPAPTVERQLKLEPNGQSNVPTSQPVVAEYLKAVVHLLPDLTFMAQRGFSAEGAADLLLEKVEDSDTPILDPLLAQPTLVADIVAAEPSLMPYRAWVEELRTAVIAALHDDADDEPEATT